jgi:hypothetical protein
MTEILLRHLEETGQAEVEIDDDFYWSVPAEQRYKPYVEPKALDLGQLSDNWAELTKMAAGKSGACGYALVWLSAILRRVGELAKV